MTREEAVNQLILEKDYIEAIPGSSKTVEALELAIKALDQPEIVHCKDCSISTFDKQTNLFYCNALDVYKLPEFYCGYARRREE